MLAKLKKEFDFRLIAGKWRFHIKYPKGSVFSASIGDDKVDLVFQSSPTPVYFPVIGGESLKWFPLGKKHFDEFFETGG